MNSEHRVGYDICNPLKPKELDGEYLPIEPAARVSPDMPVIELLEMFRSEYRCAMVVSNEGMLLGFIDPLNMYTASLGSYLLFVNSPHEHNDIVRFSMKFFEDGRDLQARHIMSGIKNLRVQQDSDPVTVYHRMITSKKYLLPIINKTGAAIGAVSAEGLLRFIMGRKPVPSQNAVAALQVEKGSAPCT